MTPGWAAAFWLPPNTIVLQEQGKKSYVDNVRDKTRTAMHFHTFIRPGLADPDCGTGGCPPGHTITRDLIFQC